MDSQPPRYSHIDVQEVELDHHTQSKPNNVATIQSPLRGQSPFTYPSNLPRRPSTSLTHRLVHLGWWHEVLSLFLSLICSVLIAAILFTMNNEPLSNWRLPIQPNSIIAVFSTVARSSLLYPLAEALGQLKWRYFEDHSRRLNHMQNFDSASRGPWGAAVFLWRTKFTALLGVFGATLVILTLLLEPFTQQVVQFQTRTTFLKNETGIVTTTNAWSDIFLNDTQAPLGLLGSTFAQMNLAILNADSDEPLGGLAGTSCPTAECHAEPYSSLAMCSFCEEDTVDNSYFDACTFATPDDSLNITSLSDLQDAVRNNASLAQNITALCSKNYDSFKPLTLRLTVGPRFTEVENGIRGALNLDPSRDGFLQITGGVGGALQFCSSFEDSPVATRAVTSTCFNSTTNVDQFNNLDSIGEITGTVSRCRLDFCAKRYESSLTFGLMNTNRKRLDAKSTSFTVLNDADLGTVSNREPEDAILKSNDSGIVSESLEFYVGQKSRLLLGIRMVDLLDSTPFLESLYISNTTHHGTGNWSYRFEQIADALSTIIQSPSNPNVTKVRADAYGPEIFVVVQWGWFIVPLLILLGTMAFFTIVVVQSWSGGFLFKTSILAVLFHGLGHSDETLKTRTWQSQNGEERITEHDLKMRARAMRVRFTMDETGTRGLQNV